MRHIMKICIWWIKLLNQHHVVVVVFSKYLKYSPNVFGKSEAYKKYDFQIEYVVYLNLAMPKYITKFTTRIDFQA